VDFVGGGVDVAELTERVVPCAVFALGRRQATQFLGERVEQRIAFRRCNARKYRFRFRFPTGISVTFSVTGVTCGSASDCADVVLEQGK
jgi:hypothetical protein